MKAKLFIFLLLIATTLPANCADKPAQGTYFMDIVLYRPLGLIATVVGAALFVGTSPLSAFATISPPHDALNIAAETMILTPAKFTFDRPLGVIYPDEDGEYRRH